MISMKHLAMAWFLLQSDPRPDPPRMCVSYYVHDFNIANDGITINVGHMPTHDRFQRRPE